VPVTAITPADAQAWYYRQVSSCVKSVRWTVTDLPISVCEQDIRFEKGTPFYERLGEERAAALLRALRVEGYRIVPELGLSIRSDQQAKD